MAKKNRIKDPANACINGCSVRPNKENAFPFASDILMINEKNQVGIEFNDERIRIDGVIADSYENFAQLMDAVLRLAVLNEYPNICFMDELEENYRIMFKKYGFMAQKDDKFIFSCTREVD